MSEELSVEELYEAKISQEFELFLKRKINAEHKTKVKIDTEKLSDIEEMLKKHPMLENAVLAEMYRGHAEALEQEVRDGNFSTRKKCNYCKRFYQDDENKKEILPCPKMQAYRKMDDPDGEKLTDEEYRDVFDGQLRCGELYLPVAKQEEIDEELAELERKHIEIIDE